MTSQSPPKPWERASSLQAPGSSSSIQHTQSAPQTTLDSVVSSSDAPNVPPKPASLSTVVNRNASNYSPYNTGSAYGSTPYGGLGGVGGVGGYNSYSSPYSRFGSSMYGSGYGGMYGGMGGMGGYGGMYGGMNGFGPRPGMMGEDPNSLTNSFSQSTQATFQIIESIVGAFGGFAQMLESTYMATHSSFFAMISVAEQFSSLRDTLGSILGIFAVLRWLRTLFAKVTGRPPPADATSLTPSAFARFQGLPATLPDGSPAPPKPSKKPFIVFILAAFGLPYLMGKMIRALAKSQQDSLQQGENNLILGPDGRPLPADQQNQQIDPSQLDFCRLKYDFTPETSGQPLNPGIDIEVRKGDVVAVLARTDPVGNASEWWRCRTRDGKVGYLPSPYLDIIKRAPKQISSGSLEGSRTHTMSSVSNGDVSNPDMKSAAKGPAISGKVGDISAESFQKSQFYS